MFKLLCIRRTRATTIIIIIIPAARARARTNRIRRRLWSGPYFPAARRLIHHHHQNNNNNNKRKKKKSRKRKRRRLVLTWSARGQLVDQIGCGWRVRRRPETQTDRESARARACGRKWSTVRSVRGSGCGSTGCTRACAKSLSWPRIVSLWASPRWSASCPAREQVSVFQCVYLFTPNTRPDQGFCS